MKRIALATALALFAGSLPALAADMIKADGIKASGNSVTVGSVSATAAGYLVVHETDDSGTPGTILGHAPVKAGANSNIAIALDKELPSGTKLVVMLHKEGNNDTVFDDADKPVTSGRGPVEQMVTVQ